MNAPPSLTTERAAHGMRFGEFVALMAALMAVNALGIDAMLPALSMIGQELGVTVENHQQLAAASTRVLAISIIRDCYEGRRMAKVVSITFMVFLAVPILAPSIGQLVLLVAPWHWIFYFLGGFSLMVALWASIRLPETLDPANRRAISLGVLSDALRHILTNRDSIGYTAAMAAVYGGLIGFINSSQQIMLHTFHAPKLLAVCFAAMGGGMALAAFVNARFVERYGMRMISHSALLAMIALCLVRLGIIASGHETLLLFTLLNGLTFFFYGLTGSNFGAMAMAPMAHLAGTASSVQGFIQTSIA
ncbi:MAG: MFS transporter, partial [Sphingomonas sp.]|nr:MFS transporter [Sphingomonas sp.]